MAAVAAAADVAVGGTVGLGRSSFAAAAADGTVAVAYGGCTCVAGGACGDHGHWSFGDYCAEPADAAEAVGAAAVVGDHLCADFPKMMAADAIVAVLAKKLPLRQLNDWSVVAGRQPDTDGLASPLTCRRCVADDGRIRFRCPTARPTRVPDRNHTIATVCLSKNAFRLPR